MLENLSLPEATIRLIAFGAIFASMAAFEIFAPRRVPRDLKRRRWFTNLAIVAIDSLVLRLVFPLAAVGVALWAQSNNIGLLPALGVPPWLAGILLFVILDFGVWLEHVMSHRWLWLWRIHQMHHSDPDFDVTTALRFHPAEILISMAWKSVLILVFGGPAMAVLVFEIVLNGTAMFNHSNIKLPDWFERLLRRLIVTPDMHRIHHSVIRKETNSNYGFNLSIWDRMFRTYTDQPKMGQLDMTIGLETYQDDRPTGLIWSLLLPIRPLVKDGDDS